jgi:uncharacterized membrane protein
MLLLREPPDNSGFMIAAYAIVAVVLLSYSVMLMVRARREEQREQGTGNREQ